MVLGFITDCIRSDMAGIGTYAKSFIEAYGTYSKNCACFSIDTSPSKHFPTIDPILIRNPLPFGKKILWYNLLPFVLDNRLEYVCNFYSIPHIKPFKQKEILWVYDLSVVNYPQFHTARTVGIYRLFYERTLQNAHKIIVPSETTKRELIRDYKIDKEKIMKIFIPHLVPSKNNIAKKAMQIDFPYLLNINTLEPRKNIVSLIKAFEHLKRIYHIPHQLVIAGKRGWKYQEIFRQYQSSPVKNEILFKGYIDEDTKYSLMAHADAFVFPSYYEGLGLPVYEALCAHCPVITSSIPIVTDYFPNSVTLVNPYSVQSIADGILMVLNNPEKARLKTQHAVNIINRLRNPLVIQKKILSFQKFIQI